MNREILFRGKRVDNGEWVEGCYYESRISGCFILVPKLKARKKDGVIIGDSFDVYEVIPETVVQYTGKTDKNSKKIFENNYCLLTKPCVMAWGVIKYKNACYWFIENKTQADGTNNMIRLCDLESNGYEIQVKDNIQDNPELLEVTECIGKRN